jgi:segregation and condensation protein B
MSEKIITKGELSLTALLEALLFVSPGAATVNQLAVVLGVTPREVEKGLISLEEQYTNRGLRIQRHRGRIQMTSAPEAASFIEEFLSLDTTSYLSRAALETLAIVTYQQPITRPQVDAIRGVSSDGVLRNLLRKGLIEEAGRAGGPGRPILYITAPEFLQHFGLTSLLDLPPLNIEEIEVSETEGE